MLVQPAAGTECTCLSGHQRQQRDEKNHTDEMTTKNNLTTHQQHGQLEEFGAPEPAIIYFGFVGMRTARPRRPRTERESQKHDFPEGQDQCRKCGMQRRVYEATHAHCPGKPYTGSEPRP